ncbi:hypothetical protein BG015_011400 [Linnemannia schmuckeri]|uniref:F-box domain-containing protein n=1 Tax=Linnemannia schmuckeri TaxID=64567 RepID=A0A9P5VEI2_9FUNG|nr:hypothetical protein BG015_011400 [Linnemannia schmuckeri]
MSAYNSNIISTCGRVIAISAVLEQVLELLDSYCVPTAHLGLVCHHWKRHLAPFRWRSFRVWPATRFNKATLLQRHGVHVQHLVCGTIISKDLRLIADTCPNLTRLMLYARNDSFWTTYAILERFFISLRSAPLTTVHIDFDLSHFDPSFFWSLSQLPRLEELTVRTHITKPYEPPYTTSALFASFLECCPTLRTFHFWYRVTYETWYNPPRAKGAFERWLRRSLELLRQHTTPGSLPEVHTRRIRALIDHNVSDATKKHHPIPRQSFFPREYQLRHLDFKPELLDMPTFQQIIRKVPYLEELDMRGLWRDIPVVTWTTLSIYCRNLRTLRIHLQGINTGTPTIPDLIAFFPQLHTLKMHFQFFRCDPDLSTLGSILQQQEEKYGTQHPLKSLLIIGRLGQPGKLVVDALTQRLTNLEFLQIDKLHDGDDKPVQGTDFSLSPQQALNGPLSADLLLLPIRCQDTLRQLHISGVTFFDKSQAVQLFTRLQEFSGLRTLHISIHHLRDLVSYPAPAPELTSIGSSTQSGKQINNTRQSIGSRNVAKPAMNFSFPTVRVLKLIGVHEISGGDPERKGTTRQLELFEIQLFVVAFPSLTQLHIQITPDVNPKQFNPARFLERLIPKVKVITFFE